MIFSDQPPAANAQPAAPRGSVSTVEGGGAIGGLPYELQQVAQRYPVTLYTGGDCAPCDTGRALLSTRGVPFNERQVKTPADVEAFQRLSGETSLPLLAIGGQQLEGFSDTTWSQYLDAAGYPKSIRLPAGYSNPPAQPMVAQAIPSISPARAAEYFHKTECFCFNQQPLDGESSAEMPLQFIVDQDLPRDIKTITLSYTIFDVTDTAKASVAAR